MSFSALDKIQMTSTSTGTSDLVLSPAETGTLANSYSNFSKLGYDINVDVTYAIVHKTANEFEIGRGSIRSFNGTTTFSLPNTTPIGYRYWGGVLAPNGEIHFAPYDDTKGMKISSTGIVSTYFLTYTSATLSGLYRGAVLAQNGDVHFVPSQAQRGQKVSTSGTVSTYSLVLTGSDPGGYSGGVLAENGDIHFVPHTARAGQKVSAAGVVSTYSLVVTDGNYSEGALVNGEIHFIPAFTGTKNVGQKINVRTGLVSTYSLVYTGGQVDYLGGVKHINGDIHFVPYTAPVGQKISNSGVVSTYSLVYTTNAAYIGGVLGKDGEIHFIPYLINQDVPIQVGQKVSVTGVVSTYSLAFTYSSFPFYAYTGGVLARNGDIYYVPAFAPIGQRVDFSRNVLIRRNVEESTNSSNSLVNFSSGTKNVFVGYPANLGLSTLPVSNNAGAVANTGINDSQSVLRLLERKGTRGTNFSNVSSSTYSLVNAATSLQMLYSGAVLAPNGDIHFIPYSANRGQKVNAYTGAVSTYSLVYTTAAGAYWGGVLAENGDIHFVPGGTTPRGQKISAAGVVSTYSLVNSATILAQYYGGVLAPNGDIHFVPYAAPVGQKVSAAGVVSTYSLVYTTSFGAHAGGVLAPNGDIHFVPIKGIGQKISAAGVVSTYSLVLTGSNASYGGVLAPNGDIHFVPNTIGQKISSRGVVSTYSLVNTAATSYRYGVLAPNGDIHFLPILNSNIGQKVSATGVVSTYSIVFSASAGFNGGVMDQNGNIYLAPSAAGRGVRISTGGFIPIGEATSPFFNNR